VKKGRQTRLKYLAGLTGTMILYESPHRLLKTLKQLAEVLGPDRKASVSRELTKLFEEHTRDSLQGLTEFYQDAKIRGEIVLVVAGASKDN
jgi:16S rRNA (cytidine1402-2'-O)-methyltransferase